MIIFCPKCNAELHVNLSPGCATEPSPYDPKKMVKVVVLPKHSADEVKTWVRVKGAKETRMVDIMPLCRYAGATVRFI